MKNLKLILGAMFIVLGICTALSISCYAANVVQITNTSEITGSDYSAALYGNTVYAIWLDRTRDQLYFDKSEDLGKTWGKYRKVIDFARWNSKILIDKSGNLFILYVDDYGTHAHLLKSTDGGDSFIELKKFDVYNEHISTYRVLVDFCISETGGIIYIAKAKYTGYPVDEYTYTVYITKSLDSGNTFSEWKEISTVWWDRELNIKTTTDGKEVYLFLVTHRAVWNRPRVDFAKSLDYGEGFTPLKCIFPGEAGTGNHWGDHIDSSIGLDGKIYVTWTMRPNYDKAYTVYLSESADKGENFSHTVISDGINDANKIAAWDSSIAIDAFGDVFIPFLRGKFLYPLESADGIYMDKRFGAAGFGIDQYITGPIYNPYDSGWPNPKMVIAVPPDGSNIFIMWGQPAYPDGKNDLYCVTLSPVNKPPVIDPPIGNKLVDEGSLLDFTVTATDPNGDILTYSAAYAGGKLPQGAAIDSKTGHFSWAPDYKQAGVYNNVKFTVSDGVLKAEEVITITVNNTNRSPVITPVGNKSVKEKALLKFTVKAKDADGDKITYSMINAPENATINSKTGLFKWRPNYGQQGDHIVTLVASDGSLSAGDTITIHVINVPIADLTCGTIAYTPPVSGQTNGAFSVTIYNNGDKDAKNFYAGLRVDGKLIKQTKTALLVAGNNMPVSIPWKPVKGTHQAVITADSTKAVSESNENNNTSQLTITVN